MGWCTANCVMAAEVANIGERATGRPGTAAEALEDMRSAPKRRLTEELSAVLGMRECMNV